MCSPSEWVCVCVPVDVRLSSDQDQIKERNNSHSCRLHRELNPKPKISPTRTSLFFFVFFFKLLLLPQTPHEVPQNFNDHQLHFYSGDQRLWCNSGATVKTQTSAPAGSRAFQENLTTNRPTGDFTVLFQQGAAVSPVQVTKTPRTWWGFQGHDWWHSTFSLRLNPMKRHSATVRVGHFNWQLSCDLCPTLTFRLLLCLNYHQTKRFKLFIITDLKTELNWIYYGLACF